MLVVLFWLILSQLAHAQVLCMPAGWAAEDRGTTGGGNASPEIISTLADLMSQASSSGSEKQIYAISILVSNIYE